MEPAKIDWKAIESEFVVDELYEDIKAPKWIDFSTPSPDKSLAADESWFCRPDCNHPKTVEDLLNLKLGSKVKRSGGVPKTHNMGDQNRRKAEDTENSPPIPSFVDLNEKKKKNRDAAAAQILTSPPSLQCFSASRSPTANSIPPLKPASKSWLQVRGILQELEQKTKESNKEDHNNTSNNEQRRTEGKSASPIVPEREAPPALDVFWFLKPCTRLSKESAQKTNESNKEDHNNTSNNEERRTEGKSASPIVPEREAPPALDVFWFL